MTMVGIIHIANGELFGGAERQILTLIGRQVSRHTVILVTLCEGELSRRAAESGIDLHVLHTSSRVDWKAIKALSALLSDKCPATVHAHGYRAAVYAALAGMPNASSVFKTEHGAPESRGAGIAQWGISWLVRFVDVLSTIWLRADVVFVTRQLHRKLWARSLFNRAHIVPNGIDPNEIEKGVWGVPVQYPGQIFPIAMVGRLEDVKGIDLALDAMLHIPDTIGAHLNIIGTGSIETELRAYAERLGLGGRVTFHGAKSNPYPYIRDAQVLLMTSRHEGMPFVLLEAFYLGVPAVVTDVGGLSEVVVDGVTGLLVKHRDPVKLAEAIIRLSRDRQLTVAMSVNAKERVNLEYTSDMMAKRYEECKGYIREARRSERVER